MSFKSLIGWPWAGDKAYRQIEANRAAGRQEFIQRCDALFTVFRRRIEAAEFAYETMVDLIAEDVKAKYGYDVAADEE